jgi:hypothetical protein
MNAFTTARAVPAKRGLALYWIGVALLAGVLIVMSENLLFRDFGDFSRAIGFMLELRPDASGQRWPFLTASRELEGRFDLSNYVFGLMGWVQSLYSDHFDLRFSGILAKLALVLMADRLALRFSLSFSHPLWVRAIAFAALMLCMFYAHNAGMLKSFYGEYLFFLLLPLLLYGLLRVEHRSSQWLLLIVALLAGLSKVQYFCVPGVLLGCLVLMRMLGHRAIPMWLLCALGIAQVLSLVPALHNPYAQLNRHQSTYWGSYLVLSDDELRTLGLTEQQRACVGIDGWGHRAVGPGGSQPVFAGSDKTCYGHQDLGMRDVLTPYVQFPATMPKLLAYALPAHFNVQYFHVYHHFPYLAPVKTGSYRSGRWLVRLSELRDKLVTPVWPMLVLAGFAQVAWRRTRQQEGLSAASLFLSSFIACQILVSLLGEGIRDLGKHLWGAQLALDFLVLTLAAQCALLFATHRVKPPGQDEVEPRAA